jgi:hypothetical protein
VVVMREFAKIALKIDATDGIVKNSKTPHRSSDSNLRWMKVTSNLEVVGSDSLC